jgi:hypothetical protein
VGRIYLEVIQEEEIRVCLPIKEGRCALFAGISVDDG